MTLFICRKNAKHPKCIIILAYTHPTGHRLPLTGFEFHRYAWSDAY